MLVYKFSHQLLAVLVHLAHTAVKWNTDFLTLDAGDKLVNTDDTALMKYEKKFMQKAVCVMYTVFSFKKEHGRCFHPKSRPLPFPASLSHYASIRVCLVYGCTLTHCVWHVGTRQTWQTLSRPTGSRCR